MEGLMRRGPPSISWWVLYRRISLCRAQKTSYDATGASGYVIVSDRAEKLELAMGTRVANNVEVDRPVLDQTGLTGKYDFVIEFTPQRPNVGNSQLDPSGPTFLEALKNQLGLKLVPQIGSLDIPVIDHVEEPSPN